MLKRFEEACRLGCDMRPMHPAEMNELSAAFARLPDKPDEDLR
jgi:hypothetical protein